MPNNGMRVVIDTNIWISFLIGKSLTGLTDAIIANRVQVLFSDDLFSELLEVLQRPKFKKYFSSAAVDQLMVLLYEKIVWVNVVDEFTDCRDVKDNFLLNLSVSGHANYLITGDVDLLVLNPFHGVEIISYQFFQNVILAEDLKSLQSTQTWEEAAAFADYLKNIDWIIVIDALRTSAHPMSCAGVTEYGG